MRAASMCQTATRPFDGTPVAIGVRRKMYSVAVPRGIQIAIQGWLAVAGCGIAGRRPRVKSPGLQSSRVNRMPARLRWPRSRSRIMRVHRGIRYASAGHDRRHRQGGRSGGPGSASGRLRCIAAWCSRSTYPTDTYPYLYTFPRTTGGFGLDLTRDRTAVQNQERGLGYGEAMWNRCTDSCFSR